MKVNYSYYYSAFFKTTFVSGNPYSLTIEPTNICNLSCTQCPTGNNSLRRIKGDMNFNTYSNIISQLHESTIYMLLYFQGEPFLSKNIFEMISLASEKKIYTATSTNGHYLTEENCEKIIDSGLKRIIISVDGTSQESYEKYRKQGNLSTVIKGIKTLIETKKRLKKKFPKIIIQFLVFKHNEHEIPEIKEFARKNNLKLQLKTAQIYNKDLASELIPCKSKHTRYKDVLLNLKKKSSSCKRLWTNIVFTWNGDLIPCCNDKDANMIFGSGYHSNILKKWHSKRFHVFRRNILLNRGEYFMCQNCNL